MSLGGIQLVHSQKMTKIWTVAYNFLKNKIIVVKELSANFTCYG